MNKRDMEQPGKKKMLRRVLGTVFALQAFSLPAAALQTKSVRDNGTASAGISAQGITRIAVDKDRIVNVRGPAGVYTLENDNQQGAAYLRLMPSSEVPVNAENNVMTKASLPLPFSVFIATEQNHNYILRLTPRLQPGETILLKPKGTVNPESLHWESASPYAQAITGLMAAMAKGARFEGYGIEERTSAKPQWLSKLVEVRLVRVYSGGHLQGRVYQVTNFTRSPVHLTESAFYQPSDRAIALSALILRPGQQGLLYKVGTFDE